MEDLLNTLIQRWWKPFGIEWIKEFHLKAYECERWTNKIMIKHFEWFFTDWIRTSDHPWDIWTRMYVVYWLKHITAKESWLRQFCCKNGLINIDERSDWSKNAERDEDWVIDRDCLIFSSDYEYRLIESALKDESELEKFLLDNIKVEWK